MAKYSLTSEQDIADLKATLSADEKELERGDIIVHKPYEFYEIQGLIKKYFNNKELFPATAGTEVYEINGYNTSVVK